MVWLIVIGSILYAALWWTMPLWPDVTVPISLGVALGTSAVPRTAGLAALASWLIGRVLLGPPQWLLFTGYYNEPAYLDILNADRPPSLLASLAGGVLAAAAAELVARKVLQRRERLALTRFGAIVVAGRDLVMPVLTLASLSAPFWRPRAPWALVLALPIAMALIAFTWVGESEFGQYYAFMYGHLLVLGGAVTLGTRLDTAEPA